LGIDHGTRRIGVAVGDIETALAFERPALRAGSRARDVEAVAALARTEGATTVVLGLPLDESGRENDQSGPARAFGAALAESGLEVVYVNERLTSAEAQRQLHQAGRKPSPKSGELDSAAARLILQEFLDRRIGAPRTEEP
jgi:putative Holliday junction resolvase